MKRTLLERLRQPDATGERSARPSHSEVFNSILRNLQGVLNTNQGNCLTDARYGLPHLTSIRGTMPWSIASFVNAIRATIERHEPRLTNVRVRHAPGTDRSMALRFEISALLPQEDGQTPIRFETYADDEGRLRIR